MDQVLADVVASSCGMASSLSVSKKKELCFARDSLSR